jgi:hypothetical protein
MRLLRGLPICMAKSATAARTEGFARPDGSCADSPRATLPPGRSGWRARPARERNRQPPTIARPRVRAVCPPATRRPATMPARRLRGDPHPAAAEFLLHSYRGRIRVALGRWTHRPRGECPIKATMRLFAQIVGVGWPRSVCKIVGYANCAVLQMAKVARDLSPRILEFSWDMPARAVGNTRSKNP